MVRQSTGRIGFNQRVRLEWLEQTANLVLAGNDRQAILAALRDLLRDKVSVGGNAERGNREKIITILLRTWVTVPQELQALRLEGLELLRRLSRSERLAVHWGMVMAVYPFWAVVAGWVGRLLKLQGSVAAAQVQRRLREQYGERETVARATRRVLRSYVDWGVLEETGTKGIYRQGLSLTVNESGLAAWLLEASLYARPDGSAPLAALLENPSLFPFRFRLATAESMLAASPRLEVLRFGPEEGLVILRK